MSCPSDPESAVPINCRLSAGEIGRARRGRRIYQSAIHRAAEMRRLEVGLEPKNHPSLLPVIAGMSAGHPAGRISGVRSCDRAGPDESGPSFGRHEAEQTTNQERQRSRSAKHGRLQIGPEQKRKNQANGKVASSSIWKPGGS